MKRHGFKNAASDRPIGVSAVAISMTAARKGDVC